MNVSALKLGTSVQLQNVTKHANFDVNGLEGFRPVTGQSSLFARENANDPYNIALRRYAGMRRD
jgi:hypothetical protein